MRLNYQDVYYFESNENRVFAYYRSDVYEVKYKLYELEDKEARLYNERHAVGRIKDQKLKFAKEMPDYADAPKELVSAADLIKQQQEILARNGENERKRQNLKTIEARYAAAEQELRRAEEAYQKLKADLTIARQSAENLVDESTAELERSIAEVEEINRKVRANLDKDKAESDAAMFSEQRTERQKRADRRIRQQRDTSDHP